MTMKPGLRKFALTAHVISSVGWLGTVVAYLALVIGQDAQTVRAAYLAMELITRSAIVPLALASLLTGLVMSLGTQWGLFRHYWVLVKLLLTIFATIVLLQQTPRISYMAGIAAKTTFSSTNLGVGELLHPGGGLLVLLVVTILAVYKPRGMTRYGWRKQHEQSKGSQP